MLEIINKIIKPIKKYGFTEGIKILRIKLVNLYIYNKKSLPFLNSNTKLAQKVIKSGNLSRGPYPSPLAKQFSKDFLSFHKGNFGICVSNGTVALSVILKAAGLKYGDEILMPALTFHSTASAALELGIIPNFVDIEKETLCIDPLKIEKSITNKTKAIVVVHLGAMVANLDALSKICKKNNLILIEDCAHAHGAMWENNGVGTFGDFGFFSFQSSKLINCGEGGFIITKQEDHIKLCLSYINCGRNSEPYSTLGVNHRLTEVQCAILIDALNEFRNKVSLINANTNRFTSEISKISGIDILKKHTKQSRQTGYFYGFRINDKILKKKSRREIVDECRSRGFICNEILYPPVYLTPEFGWKDSPIPVSYLNTKCIESENATNKDIVWVHHSLFLQSASNIDRAIKTLKKVLDNGN